MPRITTRRSPAGTRLAVCAILAVLGVPASAVAQTAQTQERDLYVGVVDPKGRPVLDLPADAFSVREDDTLREVLRVRRATDPLDLTIVIDNSQASFQDFLDVRRALEPLVVKMTALGTVSVVTVADRPVVLQEPSSDPAQLKRTIGRLFPVSGSGATLLEGLESVLKGLETRRPGRAAIVAIWLGGPEFSSLAHLRRLDRIGETGPTLHVLTLGTGVPSDAATPEGRHRELTFDMGVRDTGGRRINVLTSMGLSDALSRLVAELEAEYRLTYARPETLLPPGRVTVRVAGADRSTRASVVRPDTRRLAER